MILKTYFIIALYFTGGHVIDTKLRLHHYSNKDYEEIFYLKNKASISKNCLRHSENKNIKKMIRSKYDGKKIYKVTMNEDEDSSQETLEEEITSGSNTNFSLRNIGGVLIGVSGIMLLFISNDEFEFDESGLADDIDKQREDWEDRISSQLNLAYTLLAVGGFLIALDKE